MINNKATTRKTNNKNKVRNKTKQIIKQMRRQFKVTRTNKQIDYIFLMYIDLLHTSFAFFRIIFKIFNFLMDKIIG